MYERKKVLSAVFLINVLVLAAVSSISLSIRPAYAVGWNKGDIFVGVANGSYMIFNNTGSFKETISDGMGGFTTGCAFNAPLTELYTTNFGNTKVVVYNATDPHNITQIIDTGASSPGGSSESIVFAANGDFYVGHPNGDDDIHRYNESGVLQQKYDVTVENRGSDWIDLSIDQQTMFYTSEGRKILRYNLSGAVQLADFTTLPGSEVAYALRLLPPGDGSGGMLVADTSNIKRLNSTGGVIQTYDAPGEDSWFSLNLDPNGKSFWAANFATSNFYRFNITSSAIEVGPINTGTNSGTVYGLCLMGEPTAALPKVEGRMTGGGSVIGDMRVTHGFQLHCNVSKTPNNLQVNWGGGNKFHLENLMTASCSDSSSIEPTPPTAPFDTYEGIGIGRYNGVSGATARWTFIDAGEPGNNDFMEIVIWDSDGNEALNVSGNLTRGNHQTHAD